MAGLRCRTKYAVKWLIIGCIVSFFSLRIVHREERGFYTQESMDKNGHTVGRISGTIGISEQPVRSNSSMTMSHNITRNKTQFSTVGGHAPFSLSSERLLSTETPHRTQQRGADTGVSQQSHSLIRKINSIEVVNKQQSDSVTIPSSNPAAGFVLAIDFWDQQTFSVKNILSLQAWAAWIGVQTVEPFLVGTKFKFPLEDHTAFHSNGSVSHMRMSDVYDIDSWNSESGRFQFKVSPLLSWDKFLSVASRDVLFVKVDSWRDCSLGKDILSYNETLTKLGFNLLSARCLKFGRKQLSLSEFRSQVYGSVSPNQTTVIFNSWSQMNVPISPTEMHLGSNPISSNNFGVSLTPSKALLNDVERYHHKFLPPGGKYIGILVRAEWLIMNRAIDKRPYILEDCLNRAIGWLHSIANQTQVSSAFVGMDIGKYGSTTLKDLNKDYAVQLSEHFLQTAYNVPYMTVQSWEQTFTDISTSKVPGYVAFLQKTLAVQGECLLLVGFGSFQNHALQAYTRLRKPPDYCYLKTDSQCRIKSVAGFNPNPS